MSKHIAVIPLTAGAVTQAGTIYSGVISFRLTTGHASLLIASTAGSISITQQCFVNGEWYDPYDSAGNLLGEVCTALTVTTGKYIQFYPVLTPKIRFKIVEHNVAPTVVTLQLLFQEEN